MMQFLVVLLLGALIVWAVTRTVLRARKGSACCGEHAPIEKKAAVHGRLSDYPYRVTLDIGGMTCNQCARKVENALNCLDGVRSHVRIANHTALVCCKSQPDEAALRTAVSNAGYVVMQFHPASPI